MTILTTPTVARSAPTIADAPVAPTTADDPVRPRNATALMDLGTVDPAMDRSLATVVPATACPSELTLEWVIWWLIDAGTASIEGLGLFRVIDENKIACPVFLLLLDGCRGLWTAGVGCDRHGMECLEGNMI